MKEILIYQAKEYGVDFAVEWILWVYIYQVLTEADFEAGARTGATPLEIWRLKSIKKVAYD